MKCHIARLSANSIVKVTLSFTISTSHLSSQTGMSSMYTLFFWANIAFGSVCNCNTAQLHFPNVFLTVWCVSPENRFDRVKSLCCDIVRLLWLCALWDYTDIVFCALCTVRCALWHCDGSINPTVIVAHIVQLYCKMLHCDHWRCNQSRLHVQSAVFMHFALKCHTRKLNF